MHGSHRGKLQRIVYTMRWNNSIFRVKMSQFWENLYEKKKNADVGTGTLRAAVKMVFVSQTPNGLRDKYVDVVI